MCKWSLAPSLDCECGATEQTTDHVLTTYPIYWTLHEPHGLTVLDDIAATDENVFSQKYVVEN